MEAILKFSTYIVSLAQKLPAPSAGAVKCTNSMYVFIVVACILIMSKFFFIPTNAPFINHKKC